MSFFRIVFDGYEEPEEYDSYDEALEAADTMASDFALGAELLFASNPGDYSEENDGSGAYEIIEYDNDGTEIDRY